MRGETTTGHQAEGPTTNAGAAGRGTTSTAQLGQRRGGGVEEGGALAADTVQYIADGKMIGSAHY